MIVKATIEDLDWILEDTQKMYEEMAPFGSIDLEKCRNFLSHSIENHMVIKDEEQRAHMGMRFESHWYTSDLALYEYYVYVKPEYRKTRLAFELYKVAKQLAAHLKLPFFYGTFRKPESGFERVNKFLKRQGGIQIGANYFWQGD